VLATGGFSFCRFSLLQRPRSCVGTEAPHGQQQREQEEEEGQEEGDEARPPQLQKKQQQQPCSRGQQQAQLDSEGSSPAPAIATEAVICLPCEDSASVGLWPLHLPSLSPGRHGGARPAVRLEQARPKEAAQHGMCMAVQAFGWASGVSRGLRRAGMQSC
jgi:hypothetical protein